MIDPLYAVALSFVVLGVLMFADNQLKDRREKAHERWNRRQDLAEKQLDERLGIDSDDEDDEDDNTPVVKIHEPLETGGPKHWRLRP